MNSLLISEAKCNCWEGRASWLRSVAGKGLEYLFCSLATSVIENFLFQEILSLFFIFFFFKEMIIAGEVKFLFGYFAAC